jgi:hypothetical protein
LPRIHYSPEQLRHYRRQERLIVGGIVLACLALLIVAYRFPFPTADLPPQTVTIHTTHNQAARCPDHYTEPVYVGDGDYVCRFNFEGDAQ